MTPPWSGRPGPDVPPGLPPSVGGLSRSRRRLGLVLALLGVPALTAVLISVRDDLSLDSLLLTYLLAVVLVAVVGGLVPATVAAVGSFLLANWFLTPPFYTFEVESPDRAVELFVFVVVAILVSATVDLGARHRVTAERQRSEVRLLSRINVGEIGGWPPEQILELVRSLFEMTSVALVRRSREEEILASVGTRVEGSPSRSVETSGGLVLVAHGPELVGADARLFETLARAAARAYEEQRLGREAARAEQLAETDKVRSAMLAAVSHDLRTPLAGIKAAVSTLRQRDVVWSPGDREELLATIEESADRLTELIVNLLAMSRIQAGAVSVHLEPVALDEVVARAMSQLERGTVGPLEVPDDLPVALGDPELIERILANLIANACRYSDRISMRAARVGSTVCIDVIDHGPGVPPERWGEMFLPFQRLGDHGSEGVGLGLAIAAGFAQAMRGALQPSSTPGGGLTMSLILPAAP
jgi:K+-sensing histidine kinase KdpD